MSPSETIQRPITWAATEAYEWSVVLRQPGTRSVLQPEPMLISPVQAAS